MAFIQMSVMSKSLMRTVPVNVILPADKMTAPGMPGRAERPYKTLYLLHGILGNYTDWVNGTRIQRFAEEHDLAVVMPSGDNAFYVDHPKAHNYYGRFVGQELVELTRKMFPLSRKREDTFIGGLSMGGYGAIRNGLRYHETFGYIAALSSGLITEVAHTYPENTPIFFRGKDYVESCFGDLSQLPETDMDPKYLIRQLKELGADIPGIYMACGDQDELLSLNQDLSDYLAAEGVKHTFEIGPGSHEWDFWDTYIKKSIEWLPTEKHEAGINSGNIKGE